MFMHVIQSHSFIRGQPRIILFHFYVSLTYTPTCMCAVSIELA